MLMFHLTPKGSNRKVGRGVAVSTSSAATCSTACPFHPDNGGGCYGLGGPLGLHWRAVSDGSRGVPWQEFLTQLRKLPTGSLFRHNQAGDLYKPGTTTGRKALAQLVEACRHLKAWTYSHHPRTPATVQAFKAATANGFTVNASCQTEAEADAAMAHGLRAVFIAPSTETRNSWRTAGGNRAVVCPAQRFDAMDCATCRLCQARPQHIAIVFKAHGNGRRKVEAVLERLANAEP